MMFWVWIFSISHAPPRDVSLRTSMPGIVVVKAAQHRAGEQILARNTCRNTCRKQRPNCSPSDHSEGFILGSHSTQQPLNCAGQVRSDPVKNDVPLSKHKWGDALSPKHPVLRQLPTANLQQKSNIAWQVMVLGMSSTRHHSLSAYSTPA